MIKKQMDIERKLGYLVINGMYYTVEPNSTGRPKFIKMDQKKIKAKLNKVDRIAKKLKNHLNREAVLRESLIKLEEEDIDKLEKMLFKSKRKYKPKTREGHCTDMTVGNLIIPIVD